MTCPLLCTLGVLVQTVQFSDVVVAMPVFRQVQFLGKVVDTPVVFNDRGHGPDSAVLDKVIGVPVAMQRHVPMVFEVFLIVQFLDKVIDVPVAVQRHVSMVVETVQYFDKVIDVPVLCTTGAYGGRLLFFTTVAHGSRRSENVWRCRRCSSAWLGRLCDHATPMWCW